MATIVLECKRGKRPSLKVDREDVEEARLGLAGSRHATFQVSPEKVAVIADATASRTIWWVLTEDTFVASTSQSEVVRILGTFEPNPQAFSWMVSAGCLGPDQSWDRRLSPVPPFGRVSLDTRSWRLSVSIDANVEAGPGPVRYGGYSSAVRNFIDEIFRTAEVVDIDPEKWVLPLSGGVDSRSLLLLFGTSMRTLTWGSAQSRVTPRTDAYVARDLASVFGVENHYFELDRSAEAPSRVFDRFIEAGEGRVDQLGGYIDGMQMWKQLADMGVVGVIRGDHAMGRRRTSTPFRMRVSMGLRVLSDYPELARFGPEILEFWGDQLTPDWMKALPNETLAQRRDRLFRNYRIPVFLAALSQIKAPYVEIVNPLLREPLVGAAARLPDTLRDDKRLFRWWVKHNSPRVRFATSDSLPSLDQFLAAEESREIMIEEVQGCDWIPPRLASEAMHRLKAHPERSPRNRLARRIANRQRETLDVTWSRLSLRLFIIARMQREMRSVASS